MVVQKGHYICFYYIFSMLQKGDRLCPDGSRVKLQVNATATVFFHRSLFGTWKCSCIFNASWVKLSRALSSKFMHECPQNTVFCGAGGFV